MQPAPLFPPTPPTFASFRRNLRDLPNAVTISGITAGFIVVLISYTGPLLIILQAAAAAGLTTEQTSSWVWAVVVGNGIATIFMSLLFRQPINMPYSTAGAALLINALALSNPAHLSLSEAIGAYMISALAIMLLGISGLFGRVMNLIPQPVILAVLAGVLLRFGLGIFNAIDDNPNNPLMIMSMVAAFFLLKRFKFRAPTLGAMLIGLVIAATMGSLSFAQVRLVPTLPIIFTPTFSIHATLSLALPLFALALSSQYAPGFAVLRANHYDAPVNSILTLTGAFSVVLAFFGGHGNVLGALTAAIVVGSDAQSDHDKRYGTAVASGVWHVLLGLFGTAIVDFFSVFPGVFVSTIAGLSLSGIIASSLGGAMDKPEHREAAIVAFLCTAGDFTFLGIGAPFWGLVAGVAVHILMQAGRKNV
jgi:benzoate membrane transport protein